MSPDTGEQNRVWCPASLQLGSAVKERFPEIWNQKFEPSSSSRESDELRDLAHGKGRLYRMALRPG
jgi:hypothetical protein